jgi:hypothetical protein
MGPPRLRLMKKVFCTRTVGAILNEVGSNCMKKVFLIVTLSLFGVTAVFTTPPSGSVVFAQNKDKDNKKNPPGPPVVKDKGSHDKSKEPPPKKDRKPS